MFQQPYGPVPVSQLKAQSRFVFDALADGRPVHLTRHGRVVAVIDPSTVIPREVLADYALARAPLAELTATRINQGAPGKAVLAAESGTPTYLTRERRVYGVMREATEAELTVADASDEQLAAREERLARYLEENPHTDISALSEYADKVDEELGIVPPEIAPPTIEPFEPGVLDELRQRIRSLALSYADTVGRLVKSSPQISAKQDEIVNEFYVSTVNALATSTDTVLESVASQRWVDTVREARLEALGHDADVALSQLGTLSSSASQSKGSSIGHRLSATRK